MKIAIVEDDKRDRDILTAFLSKYEEEHTQELSTVSYPSGEEFLCMSSTEKYSLIFMDIYLGDGIDGIETARRLRERGEEGLIVFLTGSREDIWRAVQLHDCFDYVDKESLGYTRVEKLMDDVCQKLRVQVKALEFWSGKQKIRLPVSRIQFLVSHDKHVIITLDNGSEMCYRATFASVSALLEEESRFLLCNRGILLNMDFVRRAHSETFEMAGGSLLPIRKRNRGQIMQAYHEYQFEKLNEEGWR
ncbi:MAG TPA: hypothetical protein DCZ91_02585 [Lachnospiraceae bacterium]|nr:hypothetical protein [Lachnospiraceae bacterium]